MCGNKTKPKRLSKISSLKLKARSLILWSSFRSGLIRDPGTGAGSPGFACNLVMSAGHQSGRRNPTNNNKPARDLILSLFQQMCFSESNCVSTVNDGAPIFVNENSATLFTGLSVRLREVLLPSIVKSH